MYEIITQFNNTAGFNGWHDQKRSGEFGGVEEEIGVNFVWTPSRGCVSPPSIVR